MERHTRLGLWLLRPYAIDLLRPVRMIQRGMIPGGMMGRKKNVAGVQLKGSRDATGQALRGYPETRESL